MSLYPLIDRPSRITNHSFTIIDNIFTNAANYETSSGLLISDISDHLPVFAICKYPNLNRKTDKQFVKKRIINEITINSLINDLLEENWELVLNSADVNFAYKSFLFRFLKLFNKCCPIKQVRISNTRRDKPWFTNGLKNACRKKNTLYKKIIRSRSHAAEKKNKLYKNKLTSILRLAEKSYYSKLLTEKKGDAKGIWKILNNVINKKQGHHELAKQFECNGEMIHDRTVIANEFNTFFANVGPNLAMTIPVIDNGPSIHDYLGNGNINSMFLNPVSEDEIINIVKSFKPKHSNDNNDLSMYVISKVIKSIVRPLAHIFNVSFLSGLFPDDMKISKIIPLFKNGKKTEFNNYRPISILPQFSKILEKLFSLRLDSFLAKSNILSDCQYGFRKDISTTHAALELIETITSAIDNKKHCAGVFIDLKKAFDTVDHDLLLQKLIVYGVRGITYDWLSNYLRNRRQYVKVDDHSSNLLDVTCGVPQGSVLGPTLFLLYINDLCNTSDVLKFVLFADDTNIFCYGNSMMELEMLLNRELARLFVWFSVNKLSLNLQKTNYILFRKRPPDNDLDIRINNVMVPRVQSTKFLGIIMDEQINWKPHIQFVKSKLSRTFSVIHRASKLINFEGLLTLYYSLFMPYLCYCCEIWGNTYESNVKCISIMQKRVIRVICGERRLAHTNQLFKEKSILKFSDLVKYKTCIMMFKLFTNDCPKHLQLRFTIYENPHNTRRKNNFIVLYSRTNMKAMCLSVYGVKLWNNLPENIKALRSIHLVKNRYKKYILSLY